MDLVLRTGGEWRIAYPAFVEGPRVYPLRPRLRVRVGELGTYDERMVPMTRELRRIARGVKKLIGGCGTLIG